MTNEERADAILATMRKANLPHPDDREMRVVGWVVPEELAGLSDALFALDVIVKRAAQEWQDISTAPKDGRDILLYWPLEGCSEYMERRKIGYWNGDSWIWQDRAVRTYSSEPTHWMPLPAPPVAVIADHHADKGD